MLNKYATLPQLFDGRDVYRLAAVVHPDAMVMNNGPLNPAKIWSAVWGSSRLADQSHSTSEVINDNLREEYVISPKIPLQELPQPASLNSNGAQREAVDNNYELPNRRKISANDQRKHSENSYVNGPIDNANIYNLNDIRDELRPLTSFSNINTNGPASNGQSGIKKIIIVLASALIGFIIGYARNNY